MADSGCLLVLQRLLSSFSSRHDPMKQTSAVQRVPTFEIHRVVLMLWRKIAGAGVFFEKANLMLQLLSK
jgi:hypothetical protein